LSLRRTLERITSITEESSIKSFEVEGKDSVRLLKGISPAADTTSPPVVVLDTFIQRERPWSISGTHWCGVW
jgi:hypothetical protein